MDDKAASVSASISGIVYFTFYLLSTLQPCRTQFPGPGGAPGPSGVPGGGFPPGGGGFPPGGGGYPPMGGGGGYPPAGGGVPGAIPGTMTGPALGNCPPGQNPTGQCQVMGWCADKGTICVGGTCCTQAYTNNGQISQCPQGTFPNGSKQIATAHSK
jgi:hypothetical protein